VRRRATTASVLASSGSTASRTLHVHHRESPNYGSSINTYLRHHSRWTCAVTWERQRDNMNGSHTCRCSLPLPIQQLPVHRQRQQHPLKTTITTIQQRAAATEGDRFGFIMGCLLHVKTKWRPTGLATGTALFAVCSESRTTSSQDEEAKWVKRGRCQAAQYHLVKTTSNSWQLTLHEQTDTTGRNTTPPPPRSLLRKFYVVVEHNNRICQLLGLSTFFT